MNGELLGLNLVHQWLSGQAIDDIRSGDAHHVQTSSLFGGSNVGWDDAISKREKLMLNWQRLRYGHVKAYQFWIN